MNRFTKFNRYQHRVLTTYQDKVFSMPINLGTINSFYGTNLKPAEVASFLSKKSLGITRPKNLEEKAISLIGRDLYEAFIYGYTKKQWGCDPKLLPANIITRLPVRSSYQDSYFNNRYQGIPLGGYTPIFERMLKKIPVEFGIDFLADREYWRSQARTIVYTGPIDAYFDYKFGRLNWRSVRFEQEKIEVDDYQGTAVMNYAEELIPFTRIHEPKHLHSERKVKPGVSLIIYEFSTVDNDKPYYPVNFEQDQVRLARYNELKVEELNTVFGGRLAEYKYYDMDQVVAASLKLARKVLPR